MEVSTHAAQSPAAAVKQTPAAQSPAAAPPSTAAVQAVVPAPSTGVLAGIDVLEADGFRPLKGLRIGLITNQTGVDRLGRSTAEILAQAPGVRLRALFSPEHGLQGTLEEPSVPTDIYRLPDGEDIPVFSLYGDTKTPTTQMLAGLDALVFDVQDIGARFYTYAATLALAMEAAAAHDLDFFVLDRPNPINGEAVAGPVLDDGLRHFTAYLPVPVRHGMTIGELARLHNMSGRVGARLQVVPMRGWSRSLWFDQTGLRWIIPSPNMPNLEAASLYPGIGCFEASNISVGRGTPVPFRWIGAPWMNAEAVLKRLRKAKLKGYSFETASFRPSKSVFKGKKCRGIRIRVRDREAADPLALFAHLVCALRDIHPLEFGIRPEEMTRMAGTARFADLYRSGAQPASMILMFRSDAARFKAWRAPFLLY
jgi:uncharacterized protein YbbC (DUF1343 family)